jgi:predicted acylesterase/phospholipase RssA
MFSTLVLSGGSLHTLGYIGAIKYLEEQNATKHIKTIIGTSSGAIIGLLFAMGYKSFDIRSIYQEFLDKHANTNPDFENILNIYFALGIDDGASLRKGLGDAISAKYNHNDITFIELTKKTGINLMVCACRVDDLSETLFSVDTTPNLSVVSAVLASSAIPIIFKPVNINGSLYVDGALSVSCPVKFVSPTQLKDTLCFRIAVHEPTTTTSSPSLNLVGYAFGLLINSINKLNKMNLNTPIEITFIEFDPLETSEPDFCTNRFCFDMRTMKFKIDHTDIDKLILQGYTKATQALKPFFRLTLT